MHFWELTDAPNELPGGQGGYAATEHTSFFDDFGKYSAWFYADGTQDLNGTPAVDVNFAIQNNSIGGFNMSLYPIGTDNFNWGSTISQGGQTLANFPCPVGLNEWFLVEFERYCDGTLRVTIGGEIVLDTINFCNLDEGAIAIGVWHRDIYVDDVYFEPQKGNYTFSQTIPICEGTEYKLGSDVYTTNGTYNYYTASGSELTCLVTTELVVESDKFASIDTTICSGEEINIGSQFYTNAGTYSQTISSVAGCDSVISLNLSLAPSYLQPIVDTVVCAADELLNLDLEYGIYYQELVSKDGCDSILRFDIAIESQDAIVPTVLKHCFDSKPEASIAVNLPDFDVNWSNGSTTPIANVTSSGIYTATITNQSSGCTFIDSVRIDNSCYPEIYVPNVFTPDGNGYNDVFRPELKSIANLTDFDTYSFSVFDRWGSVVFSANTPLEGWDGTIDGEQANMATYVWLVEFSGFPPNNLKQQKTGTVLLHR